MFFCIRLLHSEMKEQKKRVIEFRDQEIEGDRVYYYLNNGSPKTTRVSDDNRAITPIYQSIAIAQIFKRKTREQLSKNSARARESVATHIYNIRPRAYII